MKIKHFSVAGPGFRRQVDANAKDGGGKGEGGPGLFANKLFGQLSQKYDGLLHGPICYDSSFIYFYFPPTKNIFAKGVH